VKTNEGFGSPDPDDTITSAFSVFILLQNALRAKSDARPIELLQSRLKYSQSQ
jgi:hypothetical protein